MVFAADGFPDSGFMACQHALTRRAACAAAVLNKEEKYLKRGQSVEKKMRKEQGRHAILSLNRKARERVARIAQANEPAIKTVTP